MRLIARERLVDSGLWIFLACGRVFWQAKMVATLSNLNVEHCEGLV
jgi:hypothetical protein